MAHTVTFYPTYTEIIFDDNRDTLVVQNSKLHLRFEYNAIRLIDFSGETVSIAIDNINHITNKFGQTTLKDLASYLINNKIF